MSRRLAAVVAAPPCVPYAAGVDGDLEPGAVIADAERALTEARQALRAERRTSSDARAEQVQANAARLEELLREADVRDRDEAASDREEIQRLTRGTSADGDGLRASPARD